jgi:hypothetical protein
MKIRFLLPFLDDVVVHDDAYDFRGALSSIPRKSENTTHSPTKVCI